MGPFERSYGWHTPYVHSWPGKVKPKYKTGHGKARKAAFIARHR